MIPYTDRIRVVEDGVEADEVWVRIGSVIALRSLVFVYGGANHRFPVIWKEMFRLVAMCQDNWRDDSS